MMIWKCLVGYGKKMLPANQILESVIFQEEEE